jgi:hypothetical protein
MLTASDVNGTDTKIKVDNVNVENGSYFSTLTSQVLSLYAFVCKFIVSMSHVFGIKGWK